MALSLTQRWLKDKVQPYDHPDRVYTDTDAALTSVPTLRPKSDLYTFDDGRTQLLLCLHGLLPISFRHVPYNIPIAVWITLDYPRAPPIAYVVPTNHILVRPGKHVDVSGRCSIEYLQHWQRKHEGCNLSALFGALQLQFSREPPVYSKPKNPNPSPSHIDQRYAARPPPPLPSNPAVSTLSPPVPPPRPDSLIPSSAPTTFSQSGPPPPPLPPHPPGPGSLGYPSPSISPPNSVIHQSPYSPQHPHVNSPPAFPSTLQALNLPSPPPPPPLPPPPSHYLSPTSYSLPIQPNPTPVPVPDLLDEDDESSSVLSPTPSFPPAPPRPPNPELIRLQTQVHQKLTSELHSLAQALTLDAERLRAHQADLLAGEPAIKDEMARLEAVRDVCRSVANRTRQAVQQAESNITEIRRKGDPEVDELVCATSIVHNQLINLIADDNAIEDTIYHLHRALNSGRIDLERFLRTTRVLAEEQFMKRALMDKIQANMSKTIDWA